MTVWTLLLGPLRNPVTDCASVGLGGVSQADLAAVRKRLLG
jgi:hypothetical protein